MKVSSFHNNHNVVGWAYLATVSRIASGVLLLPLIIFSLPSKDVAFWSMLLSFSALIAVLDFGFSSAFKRNISYVCTGVDGLSTVGIMTLDNDRESVNKNLFISLINAMKRLYAKLTLVGLFLFGIIGTFYIFSFLENHNLEIFEYILIWFVFLLVCLFSIYNFYLDAIIEGSGNIVIAKKIQVISALIYLFLGSISLIFNFGLLWVVISQGISIIVGRVISRVFISRNITNGITYCGEKGDHENILNLISPNAIRSGITGVGIYVLQRGPILLSGLYLSTDLFASLGITFQLVYIISNLSSIFLTASSPRLSSLFARGSYSEIRSIYLKGMFYVGLTYFVAFLILFFTSNLINSVLESSINLLSGILLLLCFTSSLIQSLWIKSCGVISLSNEVPHLKSTLISSIVVVVCVYIYFHFFTPILINVFLICIAIDLIFNFWHWPKYLLVNKLNPNA